MKRRILVVLLTVVMLLLCASCADTPPNEPTNALPADAAGTVYTIADYYNADGGFSALGLALNEENAEKVLTATGGDTLIVGDHAYSVTAESLTLTLYTQPSMDEVIEWWMEYCEGWEAQGEMISLS